MHFADMSWGQVEEYLQSDDRVILVAGACEQHCGLSLMTDVRIPLEIAERAAAEEKVLIAPPLNFGVSPDFMAYPGTISLTVETLAAVLREVVQSLYEHGFKRVFILNGHGGNPPSIETLQTLCERFHDLRVQSVEWWRLPAVAAAAERMRTAPTHANWLENFPFTRVDQPEGEKPFTDLPQFVPAGWYRSLLGDGSFGGEYAAPESVMNEMLDGLVAEVRRLLREGWPT